jgi:hypothetical protein
MQAMQLPEAQIVLCTTELSADGLQDRVQFNGTARRYI